MPDNWKKLTRDITACEKCERLRAYCERIADAKKPAYRNWDYWGRPVSGFGDTDASIWIIGLAPGAHGANRTGRMFTGDSSGDFLFAALHRLGLANQPTSTHRDDGLQLTGVFISAAARCAPPDDKPEAEEKNACREYLDREWELLSKNRVILALGGVAWDASVKLARRMIGPTSPRDKFGHGASMSLASGLTLLGSYHVSQRNTNTGLLTEAMFDEVLRSCLRHSQ